MLKSVQDMELHNVLPGLCFKKGFVKPIPENFSCCQGSGMNLDLETNSVYRCDLVRRIQRVQKLLVTLADHWGVEFVESTLKESLTPDELVWLEKCSKGNVERGFSLQTKRTQISPSRFWLMALAGIWRFGIRTHIITVRKTKNSDLIPKLQNRDDKSPLIVFVENVDDLWKAEHLYDFETIISWCERSVVPLFCELKVGRQTQLEATDAGKKRSIYTQKIEREKNKFPLDWLEDDVAYRFGSVCMGNEKVHASKKKHEPSFLK